MNDKSRRRLEIIEQEELARAEENRVRRLNKLQEMKTDAEETEKEKKTQVSIFHYKNCMKCEGPKSTRVGDAFQAVIPVKGSKRENK